VAVPSAMSLSAWLSRAAYSTGAVVAYKGICEHGSFDELLRSWMPAAADVLLRPVEQAGGAAVAAAVAASALQAAALATTLRGIESLLQAQRSAASWRAALLVALPAVAGMALYHFGWARLGWVTANELQDGLRGVQESVSTTISQLGDTLLDRFTRVDAQLAETAQSIAHVAATSEQLTEEVHAVTESLSALEHRMGPLEEDARRSAQGVGVLCELVASSDLFSNASDASQRRLHAFTGIELGEPHAALPPAAQTSAELLPPANEGVPVGSSFERAAPTYMRALIVDGPVPSVR